MFVKKIGLISAHLFILLLVPAFASANPGGLKSFFHLKHNGPKSSHYTGNHAATKHRIAKHPKPQHAPNPHR